MGNEGSYAALGLKAWKAQIDRADTLFGALSSEQVLREIAPDRNRLLYLWGHLTAIHDAMLPLLRLGKRLYLEFDVAFVINPDKSQTGIPSHAEIRRAWIAVNGELAKVSKHFRGPIGSSDTLPCRKKNSLKILRAIASRSYWAAQIIWPITSARRCSHSSDRKRTLVAGRFRKLISIYKGLYDGSQPAAIAERPARQALGRPSGRRRWNSA